MKRINIRKLLMFSLIMMAVQLTASAQLSPYIVGTLHPGDSIVIYYDVTINTSCGCTQISNQGIVSGSNFATFNTNDPNTAAADDPTITILNMFPLPVSLTEVRAVQKSGGIEVAWNVASESMMLKYEVERSLDGRNFIKIGEVASINSAVPHTYSLIDHNPGSGVNFYRLHLVEVFSSAKYSRTVSVNLSAGNGGIVIYPNPVRDRQINLQLNNVQKGAYQLVLYNAMGQAVFVKNVYHEGGSVNKTIGLPVKLPVGSYSVQFRNEKTLLSQIVIIQ